MIKSYLVLLFVACFFFSLQSEAKSQLITQDKKTPTIDRQYIKDAKIAAAKKKMVKSKAPKPLLAKVDRKDAKKMTKKNREQNNVLMKPPRKMVRLDFTETKPTKRTPVKATRTLASTKVPTNKKLK